MPRKRRKDAKLRAADLFCGLGGFTAGAQASGRVDVVLAVNHWRTAIYSHSANHPQTRHICARIDDIDPRNDATLPDLDLLLASPECTHFSVARGGQPICDQKRVPAWRILDWIEAKMPRWVLVENVREFRDWGPLVNLGTPAKPRWRPDPDRKGEIFRAWVSAIEAHGYQVDWQLLNAADFGAHTNRTRLFILARRGKSRKDIPWPEPTHAGRWRPAYEVIDWSRPCPSIFLSPEEARKLGVKRPLAEKTLRRIEAGLLKFVGQGVEPFLVTLRRNMDARSTEGPLPTITAGAEHHGVAVPFLTQYHNGPDGSQRNYSTEQPVQTLDTQPRYGVVAPFLLDIHHGSGDDRTKPIDGPLPTIVAKPGNSVCVPYLVPHFGERDGQSPRCQSVDDPLPTVTGQGAGSLAVPFFLPRQGHYDCHKDKPARSLEDPLNTITANHGPGNLVVPYLLDVNHGDDGRTGDRLRSIDRPLGTITTHRGESVAVAFLTKYYGTGGAASLDEPVDTITAKDRFGLALVSLVETMQRLGVADIGFRMLDVDELARAQGFDDRYEIRGTKAEQIRQVGNSVSPPVAEALCRTIGEAA